MSKYRVGGKSKNDNQVDSFIWHLGVKTFLLDYIFIPKLMILGGFYRPPKTKWKRILTNFTEEYQIIGNFTIFLYSRV